MISLRAYQFIEDAWQDGVEAWCRAASDCVFNGGQAWMVTASNGQANWIKRRLLQANVSLFGVQFLEARTLRRELCQRYALPTQAFGQETLEFLLRLRALSAAADGSPRAAAVARHPGTCLAALDDYAAAGWLDEPGMLDEILPDDLGGWLADLRSLGAWTPEIDRQLLLQAAASGPPTASGPLSVCFFGWDAGEWPHLNLLTAAIRAAESAFVFTPSPRGTSEGIQQSWLEACEEACGTSFETCDSSDFVSGQALLAGRLEGNDLAAPADDAPPPPELLTGVDGEDTAALVCDFVARWFSGHPEGPPEDSDPQPRLAILAPARSASSVEVVRTLTAAGISVEDELGEIAEPPLAVQIQLAILDYHQDRGGLNGVLTLVELLNQHAAACKPPAGVLLREVFPLDPVEVRRTLHGAFAEVQHHDVRVLGDSAAFTRGTAGPALRRFIDHLESWPETLPWQEALRRWCRCLEGLAITMEAMEPLWSNLPRLQVPDPVPAEAFFHYLSTVLVGASARRAPDAAHRFARVVVTTLEGAVGQIWGGLVLLDSNEGAWPLYPPENPFFDDAVRARFNVRRTEWESEPGTPRPGHLLTSADRAQLEHFRFLEALENCTGPLAFASLSRHPSEANREMYPNEWLLRCLVESNHGAENADLLECWRRTIRPSVRRSPRLPATATTHLREVHTRRRDPAVPFDDYFFNFQSLTGPDELPWAEPWSAADLDTAWNQPATFAMSQVFGAEPWRDKGRSLTRGESWVVGRLVHRWLQTALGLTKEPRRIRAEDWSRALASGLSNAHAATAAALRVSLAKAHRLPAPDAPLPLWWQGVLRKAAWSTYRCLESLAETAAVDEQSEHFLCLNQSFQAELATHHGPLRLQARCDLMLLDRKELAGAACQLIDIRTGAPPPTGALTPNQVQSGRNLSLATLLFMARAAGSDPARTQVGVVHPDSSNPALVDDGSVPMLQPLLEALARQQHTLAFGQKGAITGENGHGPVENLPLATTPVDPDILAAKASLVER